MAQWTIAMDPALKQPDGTCTLRVRTIAKGAKGEPLYVTMVLRDGETVFSDDPDVIAAMSGLVLGSGKVANTIAVKPSSPTHDVDTGTKEPLPADTKPAAAGKAK